MKTLQITIIALLSVTLLSGGLVYANPDLVAQLEAKIAELEAKIQEYKDKLQNKNAKIDELRDKLKVKTNDIEKLENRLDRKNAKNVELEETIETKNAKITHLKEKVDRKIDNKNQKLDAMKVQMSEMINNTSYRITPIPVYHIDTVAIQPANVTMPKTIDDIPFKELPISMYNQYGATEHGCYAFDWFTLNENTTVQVTWLRDANKDGICDLTTWDFTHYDDVAGTKYKQHVQLPTWTGGDTYLNEYHYGDYGKCRIGTETGKFSETLYFQYKNGVAIKAQYSNINDDCTQGVTMKYALDEYNVWRFDQSYQHVFTDSEVLIPSN